MNEQLRTTIDHEIPTVSEELYLETRKALAKEGYSFIVAIRPMSVYQLRDVILSQQHIGYISASEETLTVIPQAMEVAINPKRMLSIENSNPYQFSQTQDYERKLVDDEIRMIKEEEKSLKRKLPEKVRGFIGMRMQTAPVLVQIDYEYGKRERAGTSLFTNWVCHAYDPANPGDLVNVGREEARKWPWPLHVIDQYAWDRIIGSSAISYTLPVVVLPQVLPQKLAV